MIHDRTVTLYDVRCDVCHQSLPNATPLHLPKGWTTHSSPFEGENPRHTCPVIECSVVMNEFMIWYAEWCKIFKAWEISCQVERDIWYQQNPEPRIW